MKYHKESHYLELIIDEKFHHKTLLDLLQYYHASKKIIHYLRMSKDVYVNDALINQQFTHQLKLHDKVKLPIFYDEEIDFKPQNTPLEILYEDDFLLLVNKQAGIEVHPDSKDGLNTLVNAVSFYYQKTNQHHRIRYIHRLDKDTTGIIIFVKNYFVHNLYDDLLLHKKIKRYYYALILNQPKKEKGMITENIGKDRHHNQKRIVSKTGVSAKTYYEVKKQYPNFSLVHLELFTGRTHQIRVHMASIGCPLLGDHLYGTPSHLINRQALHAYQVELLHPITLIPFKIDAPLPYDMIKLMIK